MATTYSAIERNKKPIGSLVIPEGFDCYYLNKKDNVAILVSVGKSYSYEIIELLKDFEIDENGIKEIKSVESKNGYLSCVIDEKIEISSGKDIILNLNGKTISSKEKVFIDMLLRKEINEISVTDICRVADVNRTTFYSNYDDISDLDILTILNHYVSTYREVVMLESLTMLVNYDDSRVL